MLTDLSCFSAVWGKSQILANFCPEPAGLIQARSEAVCGEDSGINNRSESL